MGEASLVSWGMEVQRAFLTLALGLAPGPGVLPGNLNCGLDSLRQGQADCWGEFAGWLSRAQWAVFGRGDSAAEPQTIFSSPHPRQMRANRLPHAGQSLILIFNWTVLGKGILVMIQKAG